MKSKQDSLMKKKLKYSFDKYMSKGPIAQFVMLFELIAVVVLMIGMIVALLDPDVSIGAGVWQSLMHVIDGGTITGDDVGNMRYIILMSIVTIVGLIFMGMLISIINNALDSKMAMLRNGHSQIMEKDHTVIIGFDQNIYCIIEELIIANDNETRDKAIVVIDNADVVEMEEAVNAYLKSNDIVNKYHLQHPNRTHIIYRSWNVIQKHTYELANLDEARAVIINYDNDFYILRALLAVTTYLKEKHLTENIHITALLHEEKSINSAKFACAAFKNAEILYFEEILAKTMAHVSRQPGLSMALTEIFGYSGSEFYYEENDRQGKLIPFAGKQFGDVAMMLSNAILVGIKHENANNEYGKVIELNPRIDRTLVKGDKLIVMAEDDRVLEVSNSEVKSTYKKYLAPDNKDKVEEKASFYLVLDWNVSLPIILKELDDYVEPHSRVKIVSDRTFDTSLLQGFNHFLKPELVVLEDLFDENVLKSLLEDSQTSEVVTNVLLVCEDGIAPEEADAQTMMLLLHLRDIISKNEKYKNINITSEINTAEDQRLLQIAEVNDFVVGSDIANRILAQVSNEPSLHELFIELLESEGSEIYLRRASDYVCTNKKMTFGDVQAAVMFRENKTVNEICLGIKHVGGKSEKVVEMNIPRDNEVVLLDGDQLVVISQ